MIPESTNSKSEQQAVPVAREDREAAARLQEALNGADGLGRNPARYRDGSWDDQHLVQAFARHRLASLPCKSGEGADCKTCGGSRSINYAESTCQPAHQGPCPSCVGVTIATLSAALTPDATQTREAELVGFLEQVLLYADPSGDGLYDGAGDIAGVKQDGSLVLKGSFITICTRIRAALNARGGA